MMPIIKIGSFIFVLDDEKSDAYIQTYRAEDGKNYRIKVDNTLHPPYYEVFEDYREKGREWSRKLFATSSYDKLVKWLTT